MACCARQRRNLKRLSELTRQERLVLTEAWFSLLGADLALRLVPIGRLQTNISSPIPPAVSIQAEKEHSEAQRVLKLVEIAARHHVYPMRCLRQAVALQWMLKRRGISTVLRIGVQRGGAELHAHAWLEYAGQPLGQPEDIRQSFAPLLPLSGSTDTETTTGSPR